MLLNLLLTRILLRLPFIHIQILTVFPNKMQQPVSFHTDSGSAGLGKTLPNVQSRVQMPSPVTGLVSVIQDAVDAVT